MQELRSVACNSQSNPPRRIDQRDYAFALLTAIRANVGSVFFGHYSSKSHVLQKEKANRPDVWKLAAIVFDSFRIVSSDAPRFRSADSYAATKIFPKNATITVATRFNKQHQTVATTVRHITRSTELAKLQNTE